MVYVVIVEAYLPEGRTLWVHFLHGGRGRPRSQGGAPSTADYKSSISFVQKTFKNQKKFSWGQSPQAPIKI